MSAYAGGEILCLYACRAMQELDYHVYLYCDEYDLSQVQKRWGKLAHDTMQNCEWVFLKPFKPKIRLFRGYQKLLHEIMHHGPIRNAQRTSEFVLSTQQDYLDLKLYNYCIVYDLRNAVFNRLGFFQITGPKWKWYNRPLNLIYDKAHKLKDSAHNRTTFIAESKYIDKQLRHWGFNSAGFVQAPCQPSFKVGQKKKYVVQVTRLNPHKRPDEFAEIARRLPEYRFVLVYMITDLERPYWPNYERDFLRIVPSNMEAINKLILDCPQYMEEAKVYLYTGREPGATTSLGQAALAGCIPVSSSPGGGADQVEDLGVGYTYETIDEAVDRVKLAIESDISPFEVAERAKIFLPRMFMETLKEIVSR